MDYQFDCRGEYFDRLDEFCEIIKNSNREAKIYKLISNEWIPLILKQNIQMYYDWRDQGFGELDENWKEKDLEWLNDEEGLYIDQKDFVKFS